MKSHEIAVKALEEICPEKKSDCILSLEYSGKFKPYNANVKYSGKKIQFGLSNRWKNISEEIQIGLLQSLLLKIFKLKKSTTSIELYNIFMMRVHIAAPKTCSEHVLESSFNRVNEKYFFGIVEMPNLKWGRFSSRKLGSYEYGSDTVTLSRLLQDNEFLLDYVMYHELLHKKHKFKSVNGRNYHHTTDFQKKEKEFENSHEADAMLGKLAGKYRRKRFFSGFF